MYVMYVIRLHPLNNVLIKTGDPTTPKLFCLRLVETWAESLDKALFVGGPGDVDHLAHVPTPQQA
jgi:hypothetical protein